MAHYGIHANSSLVQFEIRYFFHHFAKRSKVVLESIKRSAEVQRTSLHPITGPFMLHKTDPGGMNEAHMLHCGKSRLFAKTPQPFMLKEP